MILYRKIPNFLSRTPLNPFRASTRAISATMRPFEQVLRESESLLIGYHYPCPDGIFAALAAFLRLSQEGLLSKARFVGLTVYHKNHPDALKLSGNETMFLLDFTGGPGFPKQAAKRVKSVLVLDHHKTAQEEIQFGSDPMPENLEVEFDMGRSGAGLARDYFKPVLSEDLRKAFDYVQDQDLWQWKFPESKPFGLGLAAQRLEFDFEKNPAIFDQLSELKTEEYIEIGKLKLEEEQRIIKAELEKAFVVRPRGANGEDFGEFLAVEVPSSLSGLRSQMGNDLAELSQSRGFPPMGIVAYTEPGMENADTMIKCSVRGKEPVDTTALSKGFGGGGHKLASSFLTERDRFYAWKTT